MKKHITGTKRYNNNTKKKIKKTRQIYRMNQKSEFLYVCFFFKMFKKKIILQILVCQILLQ